MQAIREMATVKNHKITVTLPNNFNYNKVEIIILPIEEKQESLSDFLLTLPAMSEQEISDIEAVRKDLNQWQIKEF